MGQGFRLNLVISRFAHLAGRSLAAFKRGFERLFWRLAGRRLVRRRLQKAHFSLKEAEQKSFRSVPGSRL